MGLVPWAHGHCFENRYLRIGQFGSNSATHRSGTQSNNEAKEPIRPIANTPQINNFGSFSPLIILLPFRRSTIPATFPRYSFGSHFANQPFRQLFPITCMAPIPQINHSGSFSPLLLWLPFRKSTIPAAKNKGGDRSK